MNHRDIHLVQFAHCHLKNLLKNFSNIYYQHVEMSLYQHRILLRFYQNHNLLMRKFHVHRMKYHIKNRTICQDQDFS